jgi:hypothetical protein
MEGYLKPIRDKMRGHRDLKVYQLAYRLAMEVFRVSRTFPEDERYSLTSQTGGPLAVWLPTWLKDTESDSIPTCS